MVVVIEDVVEVVDFWKDDPSFKRLISSDVNPEIAASLSSPPALIRLLDGTLNWAALGSAYYFFLPSLFASAGSYDLSLFLKSASYFYSKT
jgi:hypothetical protein